MTDAAPTVAARHTLKLAPVDPALVDGEQAGPGLDLEGFSVSLVCPVLNEVHGLEAVLPHIPAYIGQLVIVDGGSTDGSLDTVRRLRPDATVIAQPGRGKGNALKAGVGIATGDIVVTMDADGSMHPSDIDSAVRTLLSGCDFVKGSRALAGGGSTDFTRLRQAGNTFLTRVSNLLFGKKYTDITYGFNAYWRGVVMDLEHLADGFEFEIQIAVRAARSGLRIAEVPCFETDRIGGTSKLHAGRDGWGIFRVLVTEAIPRRRTKVRALADLYLAEAHHGPEPELVVSRDLRSVR